jgi:type III pantothenate kinase
MTSNPLPLVAVDIGNSRMKFGLFPSAAGKDFPQPSSTLEIPALDPLDPLAAWLAACSPGSVAWRIASVNRPATARLVDWLRAAGVADEAMAILAASDLPLTVALAEPDAVGIDRLLGAVAANRLRDPGRPAIVVDLGSAITVNLLSAEGVFLGGAILPGMALSARALAAFTDRLPRIDTRDIADPPPPLGTSTEPALRSGLYWGAVGAIRELVGRLGAQVSGKPEVFLTGGAAPTVAKAFGDLARHVPHMVLGGIALTAADAR